MHTLKADMYFSSINFLGVLKILFNDKNKKKVNKNIIN